MQSETSSHKNSLDSNNEVVISSTDIAGIVSYPNFSAKDYADRLEEISSFGITHFLLGGRTKIGRINIAGKGCVSVVLRVRGKNRRVYALKIRRTDANRFSMEREFYMHRIANSAHVGPQLFHSSKNVIIMEFIDGLSLIEWIRNEAISADEARHVARSVLEQCYRLDMSHLDHGQLSCLNHHIVVSKSNRSANVIDFETASTTRKASNVTTAVQSLFLSGIISRRMNQLLNVLKKESVIQLLKTYKQHPNQTNFDNILNIFR